MPTFEVNYGGEGTERKTGKRVRVPPPEALRQLGPAFSVTVSITELERNKRAEFGGETPQPVSGLALIDTGSTVTAVDDKVCAKLKLSPTGVIQLQHAGGGTREAPCYPLQVLFPGTPLPPLTASRIASVDLGNAPYLLLIGRDLLRRLRMVYNGPMGRIEITF